MDTAIRKMMLCVCVVVAAVIVAGPRVAKADDEKTVTQTETIKRSDDGDKVKVEKKTTVEGDHDATKADDDAVKVDSETKVDKDGETKVEVEAKADTDKEEADGLKDAAMDVVEFPFKMIGKIF